MITIVNIRGKFRYFRISCDKCAVVMTLWSHSRLDLIQDMLEMGWHRKVMHPPCGGFAWVASLCPTCAALDKALPRGNGDENNALLQAPETVDIRFKRT